MIMVCKLKCLCGSRVSMELETEGKKVARLGMTGNCEGYRHLFAQLRSLVGAEDGQPEWLPVLAVDPKVESKDVMRLVLDSDWRNQCGKH